MKRILAILIAMLVLATPALADVEINRDGMFPVVTEPVSVEFCITYDPANFIDWDHLWWWNYMEKQTGVTVVPRLIANEVWEEQSMIMLSSGDLPDVFFTNKWSNSEMMEYGMQDGVFIPITDYVNDTELMPNLNAAFEMYPEAKLASVLPDGNMYGLPYMMSDYYVTAAGVRAQWKTDMLHTSSFETGSDIETLDDFYNALVAFRDSDYNGNGVADEIPWSEYWGSTGGDGMSRIVGYLLEAFGLATTDGLTAINYRTGEAGFAPMMDGYYDCVQFIHKLYEEKLLDNAVFSQTDSEMCAKSVEGQVAFTTYWNPGAVVSAEFWQKVDEDHYQDNVITYQKPLVDVAGNTPMEAVGTKHGKNVFVVTNVCENPELVMRWADACYDPIISAYYRVGPLAGSEEDEGWNVGVDYIEELNQVDWRSCYDTWTDEDHSGWLFIQRHISSAASVGYFGMDECLGHRMMINENMYEPFVSPAWTDNYQRTVFPYEVAAYPDIYYTEEQNELIRLYYDSLRQCAIETTAKFIAGDIELNDDTWAEFQETLKAYNGEDINNLFHDSYAAYIGG